METISDCEIINLEEDYYSRGVFLKVKKPNDFAERDLSKLELHNVASNTQALEFTIADLSIKLTVELEVYHAARLERHATLCI